MTDTMLKSLSVLFLWSVSVWAAALPEGFEGVDLRSGARFRADSLGEKGTVLVFLSSKCPCSKSHEPVLNRLAAEFPGFRFLGVHSNADEAVADARAHFEKSGLSFPVLRDEGARLANRFGATKTPHAFVLDRDGNRKFSGGVDDSHLAEAAQVPYLKLALEAVSAGREPERAEVRALGCAIRR